MNGGATMGAQAETETSTSAEGEAEAETDAYADLEASLEENELMDGLDMLAGIGVDELWDI
jgi:hypothetical protein